MSANINIPMVGVCADTDKMLCTNCGYDVLSSFPFGFATASVNFYRDYTCYSYISCAGKGCNHMWIQCFVCDKKFTTKQGYERHTTSTKHQKNVTSVQRDIGSGLIRTRRGSNTKKAPVGNTVSVPAISTSDSQGNQSLAHHVTCLGQDVDHISEQSIEINLKKKKRFPWIHCLKFFVGRKTMPNSFIENLLIREVEAPTC